LALLTAGNLLLINGKPRRANSMLKKILIVFLLLVVVFCIAVAMRPADFRISRSAVMSASASEIFPHVNDLHKWDAWSPWAKLDPNMQVTHGGSPAGEGATYHWVGNKEVGEGKMTITQSKPPELVSLRLDFIKPMTATSQTDFTFEPAPRGTLVTWTMTGKNNFIAKAAHMVMNIDKMLGGDFEKGLAQLKSVVEVPMKVPDSGPVPPPPPPPTPAAPPGEAAAAPAPPAPAPAPDKP
jgi:hypothetical protein